MLNQAGALDDLVIERSRTRGDTCRDYGVSVEDMLLQSGLVSSSKSLDDDFLI